MTRSLEDYSPWLACEDRHRSQDYYRLLKLASFESDLDTIQQALFQATLDVSNYLHTPQRDLAEAVLEQINRAESCLTDAASKAAYDASLRASLAHPPDSAANLAADLRTVGRDSRPGAVETLIDDLLAEPAPIPDSAHDVNQGADLALPAVPPSDAAPHNHVVRPRGVSSQTKGNDAAASADRGVWEAIQNSRRHSPADSRKKAAGAHKEHPETHRAVSPAPATETVAANPPAPPTVSLSGAIVQSLIAQIPRPLVKHRGSIFVGLIILAGLGFAVQWTSAALNKPLPKRAPIIALDPKEKLLVGEQMSVLYNPENDSATRSAAVDKLRTLSAATIRHYADRFTRLADKQTEPEIQEALRALVNSSQESPQP